MAPGKIVAVLSVLALLISVVNTIGTLCGQPDSTNMMISWTVAATLAATALGIIIIDWIAR